MNLGLHFQLPNHPILTDRQRFRDSIDQAVAADALGYESVWPIEHHFDAQTSLLSSPLLLLTAIAERTSRIRLGTAILLAPLHQPLRIASDLATLDVISGGRVDCGLGRGADPNQFAGFGVAPTPGHGELETMITTMRRAWTERATGVYPSPLQRPHPPIRIAANTAETFRWAGQAGFPILVATHVNSPDRLRDLLALYRYERANAGHTVDLDDVTVLAPVFTHHNCRHLRTLVEPGLERIAMALRRKVAGAAAHVPAGPAGDDRRAVLAAVADRVAEFGYDQLQRQHAAVFDTPANAVARLRELGAALGAGRIICWFNPGGLIPHDTVLSAMEQVAVHAGLRDEVGAVGVR